ncbi:MAG: 4Fe-4S binding protein [Candidatus Bathyarchaeia archaeon]
MKIAIYKFGSCSGCTIEMLNLSEDLLKMVYNKEVEVVFSTLLGADEKCENYDISLIEGAIVSEGDVATIKDIRRRSKILIAMGSCAVLGGVPGLRRFTNEDEVKSVYVEDYSEHKYFSEAMPVSRFVNVDYYVRGCPMNRYELLSLLEKILQNVWFKQEERRFPFIREKTLDIEGTALSLDGEKCITCGRCVKVCQEIVSAIDYINRSIETTVSTPFKVKLDESSCISCGQCTLYCPVGALKERSSVSEVQRLLKSGTRLTAYVEPEVLAALGEELNFDKRISGIAVAALKKLGFEKVILWRPQVAVRVQDNLTIIPSSEAEAIYIQRFHPELSKYMIEPPKIDSSSVVWITSCLARKLSRGLILTTRELIRLLSTLDFGILTEKSFDEVKLNELNFKTNKAVGIQEMERILMSVNDGRLREGAIELYICNRGCLYGGGQPYLRPEITMKREGLLAQILSSTEEEKRGSLGIMEALF